jgi:hypothetical protein
MHSEPVDEVFVPLVGALPQSQRGENEKSIKTAQNNIRHKRNLKARQ